MAGTGRVYVTNATAVGHNQYDVSVRFDIAFDWGGYNYDGAYYEITCGGQVTSGKSTFAIGSGGGNWVWDNIGGTKTYRITMPTSGQTYNVSLIAWVDTAINPQYIQAKGSYTLGARTWQWTVSYNANGGSGAPGAQTKTYGQNLALSSNSPTRAGHTFQGWSTSAGGGVSYNPGSTYTGNASLTLYAVWRVDTYPVSYNANGGSGAPGAQTKTYGQNLALSSNSPTRAGHTFQGWSTSAGGGVSYNPGSTYTGNASLTLYAVWKVDTYTVSYNANGGNGAPGAQTKIYGQNLTLSSTRPTRTNYNFKGWGTSAGSTTVAYNPGSTYASNSAITLYAIWELAYIAPRITNLSAGRCVSSGTLTEEGTCAKVTFNWATDGTVTGISVVCNGVTSNVSASGTSGSVSVVVGASALSTEKEYPITVTVKDSGGSSSGYTSIATLAYIMDVRHTGKGVAIGKVSEKDEFEVAIPADFKKDVKINGDLYVGLSGGVSVKGILAELNRNLSNSSFIQGGPFTGNMDDAKTPGCYWCDFTNITNGPLASGSFGWLEVLSSSENSYVQKVTAFSSSGPFTVYKRFFINLQWYGWGRQTFTR